MFKLTTFTLLVAACAGSAQALMIDDFNGAFEGGTAPPNSIAVPIGPASSGYARTLSVESDGNYTDVQINGSVTGVYYHSQSGPVKGKSTLNFSLGGLNLGGANGFRIDLGTGTTTGARIGVLADGHLNSLLAGSLPYLEFLFDDPSFSGVDFGNLASLALVIDGTTIAGMTVILDNFRTTEIPEPASLLLVSLGLLGLGAIRRRHA